MTALESGLRQVGLRLQRLDSLFECVRTAFDMGDISAAYGLALTLAMESERLTLQTRMLPAYTGNPKAAEGLDRLLMDVIPVRIGYTREGWFSLSIPLLLPKKTAGSQDYIRAFLYPAMSRFFQGKEPVYFDKCVLVFRHVYGRERPEREYRDHDNIEINQVADIVALYVMKDDAPLRCAHYYCSAAGSEDRTEVYVVLQTEFQDWLKISQTYPDEGPELIENYSK